MRAQDLERVREARRVRADRAGAGVFERVAADVGDREAVDRPAAGGAGEPAALQRGEVTPNGVELVDPRGAAQQELGRAPLVRQREPGRGRAPERGRATGQQYEQLLVRAE